SKVEPSQPPQPGPTNPAPFPLPEAPFSASVRCLDRHGYDWTFTARAATQKEFVVNVNDLSAMLQGQGFAPTKSPKTDDKPAPKPETKAEHHHEWDSRQDAPICPEHDNEMKLRQGRKGKFWSCDYHDDDDGWCKYTEPYRPHAKDRPQRRNDNWED